MAWFLGLRYISGKNENNFMDKSEKIKKMFPLIVEYLDSILYKPLSGGKGKKIYIYFKCIFSSNQIVHKISFSLCFWAPDPLMDKLY